MADDDVTPQDDAAPGAPTQDEAVAAEPAAEAPGARRRRRAGAGGVAARGGCPAPAQQAAEDEEEYEEEEPTPRVKPAVPGADLEVDIVPEGADPLARGEDVDPYALEDEEPAEAPTESEDRHRADRQRGDRPCCGRALPRDR